jgi:hypothetical protein
MHEMIETWKDIGQYITEYVYLISEQYMGLFEIGVSSTDKDGSIFQLKCNI